MVLWMCGKTEEGWGLWLMLMLLKLPVTLRNQLEDKQFIILPSIMFRETERDFFYQALLDSGDEMSTEKQIKSLSHLYILYKENKGL